MPLGLKFNDLCLILDFAYLGQAQVPHESLDDFLKAGELLQIRGIKERKLNFLTAQPLPPVNRSFDSTISSTQETFSQPPTKRPREDEDISIQEASEIMKMLFENNIDIETDVTTETSTIPPPVPTFLNKTPMMQPPPNHFNTAPRMTPPVASKKRTSSIGKKSQEKEKFPCRFCNRSLASKGRVAKHENECNENPNRAIAICEICHVEIKPSALTLHRNTKHGPPKNQAYSPDYSSQPSTSPMPMKSPLGNNNNSPLSSPPLTVTEQTLSKSPHDQFIKMSPRTSPDNVITFSPALPLQILKVEKVELTNDGNSLQMTEIKQ